MTYKYSELRKKMSAERRAKTDEEIRKTLAEIRLQEQNNAYELSHTMLAESLHTQQPAIAELEKPTDIYISALRNHIRAMGGELEIIARFPSREVKITNFSQI